MTLSDTSTQKYRDVNSSHYMHTTPDLCELKGRGIKILKNIEYKKVKNNLFKFFEKCRILSVQINLNFCLNTTIRLDPGKPFIPIMGE